MFRAAKHRRRERDTPPKRNPSRKRKQLKLDEFVVAKTSVREEIVRLVCESNMSINEIVTSRPVRRVLSLAYPTDQKVPKSAGTVRKYLNEEADRVTQDLRAKLEAICLGGSIPLSVLAILRRLILLGAIIS